MNIQPALELNGAPVPGHVITGEIDAGSEKEKRKIILTALVAELPGLTSAQYAKRPECKGFGVSYHERRTEVARRLPDLVKELRARQGRKKKCPVTKTPCFVWWPLGSVKSLVGGASA
ncbi:MAG: hypothetical protein JKY93_01835 [Gammaproteobacteria bacterium]|nr:hypothetical protein [Gammaproteobacteria bacterium]